MDHLSVKGLSKSLDKLEVELVACSDNFAAQTQVQASRNLAPVQSIADVLLISFTATKTS